MKRIISIMFPALLSRTDALQRIRKSVGALLFTASMFFLLPELAVAQLPVNPTLTNGNFESGDVSLGWSFNGTQNFGVVRLDEGGNHIAKISVGNGPTGDASCSNPYFNNFAFLDQLFTLSKNSAVELDFLVPLPGTPDPTENASCLGFDRIEIDFSIVQQNPYQTKMLGVILIDFFPSTNQTVGRLAVQDFVLNTVMSASFDPVVFNPTTVGPLSLKASDAVPGWLHAFVQVNTSFFPWLSDNFTFRVTIRNEDNKRTGQDFYVLLDNVTVSPPPLVDQQQPVIDFSSGMLAIGGSSQQKLAQIVTAGVSGLLTEVRLPVLGLSGNLVVQIQGVTANKPNGVILTSQTVPASTLPPSPPGFRSIIFSTPVAVVAGSKFAIVLSSTSQFAMYRGPVGDSYSGGNAYFDALPNTPGVWVCICDFPGARFDLPFQTLVETADNIPPTITCPANITATTFPGQCSRVVSYPAPTATDNQPGVTVTSNPPSGSSFPKGVTTVMCTARDAAGNSASCSFTVTVLDNEAPTLTAPAAVTALTGPDASGCAVQIPDSELGVAVAADNCSGAVTISRTGVPAGNLFPVGTTTITYTATDASGNATTATQEVTVNDNTPPMITISSKSTELWPPDHRYVTINLAQCVVSASDNCGGNISTSDIYISSVSCDEPDNAVGEGDGDTIDDVVIASNCKSVSLRAERDGAGNGRVYTINVEVMDSSGNVGRASYRVSVPHDRSSHSPAVDDGLDHSILSACGSADFSSTHQERKEAAAKSVAAGNQVEKATGFQLYDNYPNPFNPSTRIAFELPVSAYVSLKIFNTLGQEVATLVNGEKGTGRHEVVWDASNLPSGVYFYRLQAGAFSDMKKLLLLK